MVLQKRLYYGFNGYQVPPTPRATRSARRRGTVRRRAEEKQICAFDLLATVAGDLLLKNEGSPSSSNASREKDQCTIVDQDFLEGNKALNMELCDKGSYNSNVFGCNLVEDENLHSKESSTPKDIDSSGFTSVITSSNCLESLVVGKLCEIKDEMASVPKVNLGSSEYTESGNCKLDSEAKTSVKEESPSSEKVLIGTEADMCNSEDPVACDADPPALVRSDTIAKVPLCEDSTPQKSFPVTRDDDVKVVSRDDDENSSGCTHPNTVTKYRKPVPRIGDRRIRKILASKCWKVAQKYKDETYFNTSKHMKPIYHIRKDSNKRQMSQMNIPIKKRKLFCRSLVSNSNRFNGEDYYESREKGVGHASDSHSKLQVTGASCWKASTNAFESIDSHVKLRIKSFKVPELFIEIPETATVGSLKKTVMEAVTTILGGGLCIGVLIQGKKVRDDNKTLLQSGISNDNQVDSLGFTLEPNASESVSPLCSGDSHNLLAGSAAQRLASYSSMVHLGISDVAAKEPRASNLESFVESDRGSEPSPIETSREKSTGESKAIVPVQGMNVEALVMVPANLKSKRSEMAQRRIRRPFSVAEVEALVEAVDKLGTGRWRDVKIRAFDNAEHRTYVDLKDKWKTLVHTARIAPQQRRGEPVPQELLDRVLNAHAYWSQQQAKQHPENCLLL